MNRLNNLFEDICSIENLEAADIIAQKGKAKQFSVIEHNRNRSSNIAELHRMLIRGEYKTSEYTTFFIRDPKERLISRLPYYPDRIVHHAIMNKLEPVFVATFTADTFSSIKGRGIHAAHRKLTKALKDVPGTRFCLKLDIRQFYPSIDNEILKQLLRRKLKDQNLLALLDEIIDSAEGLPIGNYLSQYLANFYLTYFDHWLKETKGVKYYFRYADDIVILSDSKRFLHALLGEIRRYLADHLKLEIKENYQVFPVCSEGHGRGIDFVGYVFYHSHILIRKSIKQSYARMMANRRNPRSEAAFNGWLKHANCVNLRRKIEGSRAL
jgi:retron-type reverse transcriptase